MPLEDLSKGDKEAIEHEGLPCNVYEYSRNGKKYMEFTWTGLEGRAIPRARGCLPTRARLMPLKSKYGGKFNLRFEVEADSSCRANHEEGVCKCNLGAWHMGQDECMLKAYLREGKEWVIAGVRGLRKKKEGPGITVSGFQDEIRGVGFGMTCEEMWRVNAFCSIQGRAALNPGPRRPEESPGIRTLDYGKNKEGYWN